MLLKIKYSQSLSEAENYKKNKLQESNQLYSDRFNHLLIIAL